MALTRLQAIVREFERESAAVDKALTALEKEAGKHRASLAKREAAKQTIANARETRSALTDELEELKKRFVDALADEDEPAQGEIRERRQAIAREMDGLTEAVTEAEKTISDNPVRVREMAELWARGRHLFRDDYPKADDAAKELADELRSLETVARERVEALRGEEFSRYVDYDDYKNAEGRLRTGDPNYGLNNRAPVQAERRRVTSTNDVGEKVKRDPRYGRPGTVFEDED